MFLQSLFIGSFIDCIPHPVLYSMCVFLQFLIQPRRDLPPICGEGEHFCEIFGVVPCVRVQLNNATIKGPSLALSNATLTLLVCILLFPNSVFYCGYILDSLLLSHVFCFAFHNVFSFYCNVLNDCKLCRNSAVCCYDIFNK